MGQQPHGRRPSSRPGGTALSWVLVGVLAAIAIASFALDGQEQSSVIVAALILGLVGILVTSLRTGRNKQG